MAKLKRFGEIAIERGWTTESQVEKALAIQKKEDEAGEKHRLIGIIMLAEGFISTTDLISTLKKMDSEKKLTNDGA